METNQSLLVVRRGWQRMAAQQTWGSLAGLSITAAFVLLGNLLYLIGWRTQDAVAWTAEIGQTPSRGIPAVDPNAGFLTQSLGHVAAMDLLHFHLPWWNYFEGIGSPLAGEMQSGALSPFVLLFALHNGMLWFHLALELLAAISTYLLIRRWTTTDFIAIVGAVAFGLNGTFAWLGNSVENPVAYLPLALLGIEVILEGVTAKRWGWTLLAIAIAGSLYAGFPEVAALDLLFIGLYGVVRSFSLDRTDQRRMLWQMGTGVGLGAVLALPLLVAFRDFENVADIGVHVNAAHVILRTPTWAMFISPYSYGSINGVSGTIHYWGGIGGYFGIALVTLGLFGLFGAKHRALRLYLGGWIAFALLGSFNIMHVMNVWALIPLINQIVLGRYVIVSCEMALVLLAMFGLDDLFTGARNRRNWHITAAVSGVALVSMIIYAASVTSGAQMSGSNRIIVALSRIEPVVLLAGIWFLGSNVRRTIAAGATALLLLFDVGVNFAIPEALAPAGVHLAQGPLTFLQTNLHGARFMSMTPIQPNWGSYFGISELNAHDLPFPNMFEQLVATQIPLGIASAAHTYSIYEGEPGVLAYSASLAAHLANFENTGVKYMINFTSSPLSPALANSHLRLVYRQQGFDIYQLPATAPMYTAAGCTTSSATLTAVSVTCSAPSTLVRRELSMPGWHVTRNGVPAALDLSQPYQRLALPAGTSHLSFSFLPPHEGAAEAAFVVAVVSLLVTRRRNVLHRRGLPFLPGLVDRLRIR